MVAGGATDWSNSVALSTTGDATIDERALAFNVRNVACRPALHVSNARFDRSLAAAWSVSAVIVSWPANRPR